MLSHLFDALYLTGLTVASPYLAFKLLTDERYRFALPERFGRIPPPAGDSPRLWLHCASVGEINLSRHFIRLLGEAFPGWTVCLSTMTPTGRRLADKLFPTSHRFALPIDLSWPVRLSLDVLSPRALILVELELWPNLILEASRRGIPVAIVNGRISDRGFERSYPLRRVFRSILSRVSLVCAQNATYAERFVALGAAPGAVSVTGNMKYDVLPSYDPERERKVREEASLAGRLVLVGGSTHKGEDEALIAAFEALRKDFPTLALVLAPRHPERLHAVKEALENAGLPFCLRTEQREAVRRGLAANFDVLVVDTMGELVELYRAADVAFVGGSLVPHGGHNVLEPAALRKPVVTGPHCFNFTEEVALLRSADGIVQVGSEAGLGDALRTLLARPEERERIGNLAAETLREKSGAGQRNIDLLRNIVLV